MNAFELMKHIGFKGEVLPPPVLPTSYFITTKSIDTFSIKSNSLTTLHIDWGDGTSEDRTMTTSFIYPSKNYGTSATRTIVFSGNGNTNMTDLAGSNNLFTEINISSNRKLTYLDVYNNSLTNIDISSNVRLSTVQLYNNPITALDISANPDITYLDIGPCAINSAGVNTILAKLVEAGKTNGWLYANQTPSAPPTGQGLTDKATLISRGWTVNTD